MENDTNDNREDLLKKIMQYKFFINDLALYLDTHPNDQKALDYHNDYVEKLKKSLSIYESKYEPLSIETVMDTWEWAENLWPWERGYYR